MRAIRYCLGAAAGAVALGLATLSAQAAPAGSATMDLKGSAVSSVEKAARRCWWHRGHRHCRYYRDYGYYPHHYGYGPSIRFYWGGHRHGHHRHHRRWH
jgi:hypothetical protein